MINAIMNTIIKPAIVLFLSVWVFAAVPLECMAADDITIEAEIKNQLNAYELDKYDLEIKSQIGEIEGLEGTSFTDIVFAVLTGELNLSFSEILKLLGARLFSEVYDNLSIMRNLIIIAILGALLKAISGSFGENSVSEIGFYIIYTALVTLLIVSFIDASQIAASAISKMASFMQLLIPLIMALLVAAGRYSISFIYHPATMGVVEIAAYIIDKIVITAIILAAVVQMVNYLLPGGVLDNMTGLIKSIISTGLKWIAIGFMAVMGLQTVTAPIVGGIVSKGAKAAVGAVPVVGQAFKGAVDSVFYWGSAMKNGVAVAALVIIVFICIVPVIKLLAIALIYKLTAAIIQPIADDRVSDCINAAGSYIMLFLSAVSCVLVMFTVLIMMVMAGAMG